MVSVADQGRPHSTAGLEPRRKCSQRGVTNAEIRARIGRKIQHKPPDCTEPSLLAIVSVSAAWGVPSVCYSRQSLFVSSDRSC